MALYMTYNSNLFLLSFFSSKMSIELSLRLMHQVPGSHIGVNGFATGFTSLGSSSRRRCPHSGFFFIANLPLTGRHRRSSCLALVSCPRTTSPSCSGRLEKDKPLSLVVVLRSWQWCHGCCRTLQSWRILRSCPCPRGWQTSISIRMDRNRLNLRFPYVSFSLMCFKVIKDWTSRYLLYRRAKLLVLNRRSIDSIQIHLKTFPDTNNVKEAFRYAGRQFRVWSPTIRWFKRSVLAHAWCP